MDEKRLEEIIKSREKNYIWLEKELKTRMMISTAATAVFFLVLHLCQPKLDYWWIWMAAAILAVAAGSYYGYHKEYRSYLRIMRYLEAFENGDYEFRSGDNFMHPGISSQMTEQLERLGAGFDTLKHRIEEEKENTKKLVTNIAHQLKTPLAAVRLNYELIADPAVTDVERQELCESGNEEIRKLTHLLDVLMGLSRMEAEMIQIRPAVSSLKEMLLKGVNTVILKANEKNINIELEDFEDIRLALDEKWMPQAISNLLDNAVKYSPADTRIQIRVEPRVSYLFIEIQDEGIGIPRAEYAYIFQRFYRGSSANVKKSEGAGVGLYLVRYILEAHGGSVRALPVKAGGTTFQLMLPKANIMNPEI